MTTIKQFCVGVAVAGAVAGAGSAVGTAVAYADDGGGDDQSSLGAGGRRDAIGKPIRAALSPVRDALSPVREALAPVREALNAGPKSTLQPQNLTSTRRASDTGASTNKPQLKLNADLPKLSQRFAERVQAARAIKDHDVDAALADAGAKFTRTLDAVTDLPTTIRRTVEVQVAGAQPPRPLVSRKTALAVSDFLATAPKLLAPKPPTPKAPAPKLPAPLVPLTLVGAATPASYTTRELEVAGPAAAQTVAPTTQHVLVIGVDGTNLSKVLEDPVENDKFIALMNNGTTSASTIKGHTTISNPSWTTILTGVWDSKHGVINNIFTPDTYDRWPTVFDQLEGADPTIKTTAIGDWKVVTDIADAGQHGADKVIFVPQVEGDTDWRQTDAAVTAKTVDSILGDPANPQYGAPSFTYTYLVQVDEAGHAHGGDSQEYADAVARTDENLGTILQAVADREAASCAAGACEDWTVIVVTDHGHQPQQGFGHGFQSPRETSTFVIAEGPGYGKGEMNTGYTIADVTPTVVRAFGINPTRDADGTPLLDRGATQVDPADLQAALKAQIASQGWPDPATTVVLGIRTVFASIPYFVIDYTNQATGALQDLAAQDIFLVSPVASVLVIPVQIGGDVLFVVTNVGAQIIGPLTGAGVIPPSDGPAFAPIVPVPSIAV